MKRSRKKPVAIIGSISVVAVTALVIAVSVLMIKRGSIRENGADGSHWQGGAVYGDHGAFLPDRVIGLAEGREYPEDPTETGSLQPEAGALGPEEPGQSEAAGNANKEAAETGQSEAGQQVSGTDRNGSANNGSSSNGSNSTGNSEAAAQDPADTRQELGPSDPGGASQATDTPSVLENPETTKPVEAPAAPANNCPYTLWTWIDFGGGVMGFYYPISSNVNNVNGAWDAQFNQMLRQAEERGYLFLSVADAGIYDDTGMLRVDKYSVP